MQGETRKLDAGENLMGRNGRDLGPDREADMCGGAPVKYHGANGNTSPALSTMYMTSIFPPECPARVDVQLNPFCLLHKF